jgi:hypothetical protein
MPENFQTVSAWSSRKLGPLLLTCRAFRRRLLLNLVRLRLRFVTSTAKFIADSSECFSVGPMENGAELCARIRREGGRGVCTSSMRPRFGIASARSLKDQRSRSRGASEQARAIR